ncbi:LacI family DNA-binding transcriptional regulator [Nocardioides mesophilus]|uniref:LacI family DNA-binding transcriptional regulator n=1 Tax=Nocardioides mesophilus TaxID=433659 RepID=A0A7G9RFM6_9ACTN|nr:LacI family DNA-binding transcriptional regulator [Nocardioides mesophilus]QNN54401.1 LacI family DNA-binding transcriptional regulator [Nocardioides mesophilus]
MPSGEPTIRDVAARAGVSKSLVSLALQNSSRVAPGTRQTIRRAAEELGYRPNAIARTLGAHRSRTIGVFVLDLHNPIYVDILDGVQAEAHRLDYRTIVVVGSSDRRAERAELDKLMEFRVEGLVTVGHRLPAGAGTAISESCPAVLVGAEPRLPPHLVSVSTDDIRGSALAIDHLVALGHSAITHVTGGNNSVARKRERGYVQAMERHGLQARIRCIPGGFTDERGYQGTIAALGGDEPPTALFVANDFAAIGALAAAADRGLEVPRDLSVIGYDGTRLSGLRSIGLTTVAQPLKEMGVAAATQLCSRLDTGQEGTRRIRMSPGLLVRTSTGPPPRHAGVSEARDRPRAAVSTTHPA